MEVVCGNPNHGKNKCKLKRAHGPPTATTNATGDGRLAGLGLAWAKKSSHEAVDTHDKHLYDPDYWPTFEERKLARQELKCLPCGPDLLAAEAEELHADDDSEPEHVSMYFPRRR